MKPLLALATVLLLLPAASAEAILQGELAASSVSTAEPLAIDGKGLFVGFFQGEGKPSVGWGMTAETALVDLTTQRSTTYGDLASVPSESPQHSLTRYSQATLAQTLGTRPPANDREFWMMVTPLQDGQATGFGISGTLAGSDVTALGSIAYQSDPKAPAAVSVPSLPGESGLPSGQYSSAQAALQWMPGSASAPLVVKGDFIVSVFQSDFQVTTEDGRADHYSTGDGSPSFDAARPHGVTPYDQARADITVHDGVLTLMPNGRDVQVDLARLTAPVHGGLDFKDAQGSLAMASGDQPLVGQVHLDATDLQLTLEPRGSLLAAQFSGTVDSVAVDGQPLALSPSTAVHSLQAPAGLVWALVAVFSLGSLTFTVLAARKKTDRALLLARAQAFFEVQRYKAALRTSRRLLRLDPGNVDATTVAAMSLVRLGRPAEAKPLLEAGMSSSREHQGLLSVVEALVLFHQGDAQTAAERLQKAFAAYPALNDELAAVDLLDQLLLHVAAAPRQTQVVSP
jgi:hypothetical protein